MKDLIKMVIPVLLATIWISLSEFVRNEILLKSHWNSHYKAMGLIFPSEPANGAIWALWSLLFAILIFILLKKFSFLQGTFLAWFAGFIMMWVVIGNMNVLPYSILYLAIPLSFLETFLAAYIIHKVVKNNK